MTCADCIHFNKCFELRGPCREYKDMEMIRREIIDINNAYKTGTAAHTQTGDKTVSQPARVLRRGSLHLREEALTDPIPHGDP